MGRPGTPSQRRALVAKRRADAIDMRLAGHDLLTVGRTLRYGQWEPGGTGPAGEALPDVQVSADKTLMAEVSKDIARALAERRERMDELAGDLVALHDARIERYLAALDVKAKLGSPAHVREARALLERQARMHGIDRPVKHEVSVPEAEAAVIAAVADLVELVESRSKDGPSEPAPAPVRAIGDPR